MAGLAQLKEPLSLVEFLGQEHDLKRLAILMSGSGTNAEKSAKAEILGKHPGFTVYYDGEKIHRVEGGIL